MIKNIQKANKNSNKNSYNKILIQIRQIKMGQQQVNPQPHSARNYHYQSTQGRVKTPTKASEIKQNEGILKLRSTPFPNCVQISNDGMLLFLENAQTTLFQLLENRLYTNRLFPIDDVQRLIENIVYTLAYMAENNVIYRDLCAQNIYYCNGMFKLLPNQLIDEKFYDKSWQHLYGLPQNQRLQQIPFLSPQLIIALRMKQKSVSDPQILNKSLVFILGLILLQATTLLPSTQCFDSTNYDIFNNIVSQRLQMVQEHYNQCIARIVANMLDYDFNQRMDLKELAIWVNRQLAAYKKQSVKQYDSGVQQKKVLNTNKSTLSIHKSRLVPNQPQKQLQPVPATATTETRAAPPRSYSRTNMVYINGGDDYRDDGRGNGQELTRTGAKNFVYLENLPQYQVDCQIQKKIQEKGYNQPTDIKSRHHEQTSYADYRNRAAPDRYSYQRAQKYSHYLDNKLGSYADDVKLHGNYGRSTTDYGKSADYVPYQAPPSPYLREVANLKTKDAVEEMPYKRNYDIGQGVSEDLSQSATAKLRSSNKYYPSLSDIQNMQKYSDPTKRIAKHNEVISSSVKNSRLGLPVNSNISNNNNGNLNTKQCFESKQSKQSRQSDSKCSVNDGSINRIKLEIEKSRKLIQEFRKNQGISQ